MATHLFAPSPALVTVLAALVLACGEDPQSPDPGDPAALASSGPATAVATATYSVKDLGTLGGGTAVANGINDHGSVVGLSALANGRQHAFLWHAGKMSDLGALAGGASEANDINNGDVAVGWSTVANGAQRAVRWQNGKITNLGTLGGRNSAANAINDNGIIVGWSDTKSGSTHAFVWQNGVMRDLGTLSGLFTTALDINLGGKIVGESSMPSGDNHAVTWQNGVIKDLGTNGHNSSVAEAINTKGQIAGFLGAFPDDEGELADITYPFIFFQQTFALLPRAGSGTIVKGINRDGVVVGFEEDDRDDPFQRTAWVVASDSRVVLPSLNQRSAGDNSANDINAFGAIVGSSAALAGDDFGPDHAVLWRPK